MASRGIYECIYKRPVEESISKRRDVKVGDGPAAGRLTKYCHSARVTAKQFLIKELILHNNKNIEFPFTFHIRGKCGRLCAIGRFLCAYMRTYADYIRM